MRNEVDQIIKENKADCTFPWLESMRGYLNYSTIEKPSCKNDFILEVGLGFAVNASAYTHPNCLGNDETEISMSQFIEFSENNGSRICIIFIF